MCENHSDDLFANLETEFKDGVFSPTIAKPKERPTFPCEQCGGTGQYRGTRIHQEKPHCFACKGKGHFFTSYADRMANRVKAQDRERKSLINSLNIFDETNPGLRDFLKASASWSSFAGSLHMALEKYGDLTPKQLNAALSMRAKSEERNVAKVAARTAQETAEPEFPAFAKMFLTSSGKLKHPKLRLVSAAGQSVVMTRCGPASRTPGHINITDGGGFGVGKYFGRLSPDGRIFWREPVNPDVRTLLAAFEAAPEDQMKIQGIRTGNCCLCGRELTKTESVERGIGPICAARWGF